MDFTIILIFIILSAISALAVIFLFRKKPVTTLIDEAASDYAEGLNLLFSGKREQALKKLKDAVTKNSRNVDAYLKIGDILREMGQIERAINVHKYLTVRSGLKMKQQEDILHSLAKDYQAANEYDKALGVLNKVLEEDKSIVWAQEMKLRLFEQKEEWDNAFQVYKDFKKNRKDFKNGRLALYKVQKGLQFIEDGKDKDAQNCFRDAIKIDPNSPPAYIYLADIYKRENRKSEALKILKQFVEKVPSQSYLAFERIKELLYEGGVYGEIENLYFEIIDAQPNNLMARLALAENYEKKGELEKAINVCLEVLEKDPAYNLVKKYLVRLYHKSGDEDKAVNQALDLIDESLQQKECFKCELCGYESEEPFWRCPECLEWETFVKN
ncbi:MAG: tetratricopeptide repeat protein [bacterium]